MYDLIVCILLFIGAMILCWLHDKSHDDYENNPPNSKWQLDDFPVEDRCWLKDWWIKNHRPGD